LGFSTSLEVIPGLSEGDSEGSAAANGILPICLIGASFLIDAGLRFGSWLRTLLSASLNERGGILLQFRVAHFAW